MTNTQTDLTANQTAVVDYLAGVESATSAEVRKATGMSVGAAAGTLSAMVKKGLIAKRVDDNGGSHFSAVEAAGLATDNGDTVVEVDGVKVAETKKVDAAPQAEETAPATTLSAKDLKRYTKSLSKAIAKCRELIEQGAEYAATPSGKFAKALRVDDEAWATTDGAFVSTQLDDGQWAMFAVTADDFRLAGVYAGAGTPWKVEEIAKLRG